MTHEETFTFHAREIRATAAAAGLVPLPDQGSRRASSARRAAPRARVHHEGLLLVRSRRGGARRELPARTRRLPADLRALRHRVLRRPGRVGDDGRRASRSTSWRRRARARTRSSPARTATSPPTSRSRARCRARRSSREPLDAPEEVETPGITTIEALAELPRRRPGGDLEGDAGREGRRHGRARARARRRPARAGEADRGARRRTSGPATEDEIRAAFGADPGSLGPVGFKRRGRRRRDAPRGPVRRRREPHRLASARRRGRPRLRGSLRRHPRVPIEGDRARTAAASCGFQTAIEVGHIFKLGTRYSVAARRDVPRRGRQGEAARDGQLRNRARPGHGRRGRAAPRRARDLLAGGDRAVRRARGRAARGRGAGAARPRRRCSPRAGPTCCSTTARCDRGRSSPTPT